MKTMKTYLFILVLLLGAVGLKAQSVADQQQVLQLCINMEQVTAHFTIDKVGVPLTLYSRTGPAQLLPGLQVMSRGKYLSFLSNATFNAIQPDEYFTFSTVTINGSQANVVFSFSYHSNTAPQVVALNVTLHKNNGIWTITVIN